jgi:hypothetical protein
MSARVSVIPGQPLLAIDGVPTYLHGANYAWKNYGEFGEVAAWGGANRVANHTFEIEADFQQLARHGVTTVRWFLFTDGRNGIRFDSASGLPTGLTDGVFEDMDLALAIARAQGIRVVFPVLDFSIQKADAHPQVVRTDSGRKAFIENVLSPVLARYAREDSILAWEVMNEPEYVISGFLESPYVKIPFEDFALFTRMFANAVHQFTDALVTLGGADPRYISTWDRADLGIDFNQVHGYYDKGKRDPLQDLFGKTAVSYRTRRPLIIGEVPGKNDTHIPPVGLGAWLDFGLESGYAGVWPWAFTYGGPEDRHSPYDAAAMVEFAHRHPNFSNPAIG